MPDSTPNDSAGRGSEAQSLLTEQVVEDAETGTQDPAVVDMAARAKRKLSQPVGASAGCIFKNPEEIPAGRLIDELGLKNACVGDACVSDVHANFIINRGHARARDITILIDMIRKEAMENRGIDLKSEAQVIGDREPQF